MKKSLLLTVAFCFGASATALVVVQASTKPDPFAPCRADSMVDYRQLGGDFELIAETGEPVRSEAVITEPTLLYMGYTFCPDVCPMDTARNAEALYQLEERGIAAQSFFISFDPKRDTPEVLAEFTDNFHPKMLGLTGSPQAVKAVAEAYATGFEIRDAEDDDYYLIDHTTYTYVVLPGHGVVDILQRDITPEEAVDRVACLVESV